MVRGTKIGPPGHAEKKRRKEGTGMEKQNGAPRRANGRRRACRGFRWAGWPPERLRPERLRLERLERLRPERPAAPGWGWPWSRPGRPARGPAASRPSSAQSWRRRAARAASASGTAPVSGSHFSSPRKRPWKKRTRDMGSATSSPQGTTAVLRFSVLRYSIFKNDH